MSITLLGQYPQGSRVLLETDPTDAATGLPPDPAPTVRAIIYDPLHNLMANMLMDLATVNGVEKFTTTYDIPADAPEGVYYVAFQYEFADQTKDRTRDDQGKFQVIAAKPIS